MASSNIINPDDMEDKLDEEARAAGFEFTPENPQQRLFVLLEEPASGTLASIIGYIIMILIFTSSTCLIVETYPSMGPCAKPEQATALGYDSPEDFCADYDTTVAEAEEAVEIFHFLEMLVILVFTAEYLLRLSLCTYRPKRNRTFANYFFKPLNIVDLISVVPWWFERIAGGSSGLAVVRMLRFARVFRLLKAGSFLKELQLFVWGYYRAREGLLLLLFLLFMYLCCFGAILYMLEYAPQSEACFEEAGFPECWGHSDALGKDAVAWDTIIEFGAGCDHCDGNLWNCTAPGNATVPAEVRMVRRLGDCIRENETAGEIFDCVPDIRLAPHYTDSDCRACSAVQWPGKEPLRCAVRGFTSIPVTTYFVMATMTTVGYGEHYPGSAYGQIACGVCMVVSISHPPASSLWLARRAKLRKLRRSPGDCFLRLEQMGIFVLALPMVIIGQAFEETIREEKKMSTVRERRLKMILLKRETEKDDSEREQGDAAKRQELEAMVRAPANHTVPSAARSTTGIRPAACPSAASQRAGSIPVRYREVKALTLLPFVFDFAAVGK